MDAVGVCAVIAGVGFATGAVSYLVFRTVGIEFRRRHHEVGTAVFLQLGVIYAVFLAFVFGQALTSFVAADEAVDAECAALHGAAIIGKSLPKPLRTPLAIAMNAYTASVIDSEWAAMRLTRLASPEALAREEEMLDLADNLDVSTPKDVRLQTQVVTLLVEAHRNRESRLFQAGQGIPVGFWTMILGYCMSLVVFVAFSSLESAASHATVTGVFGALNAVVLLAVLLLQYPFEGPFQLSPDSFVTTRANIASTFGS